MARNIVHEGGPQDVMPWTNTTGAAVVSGQAIKIAHTIGLALVNIADGAVGSVAVGGVIRDIPKDASEVWAQGEKLVFHVGTNSFADSAASAAAGDVTGGAIAWLAAASGDTVGEIRLTPGNTTVT